jgi:acyl-CoA reductase-like NAD-dependent aldehyde dehydrogenase
MNPTTTDDRHAAPKATLDPVIARIAARKDAWVRVPLTERVTLLERAIAGVVAVAEDWVAAACHAKDIDPASPMAGEEWISGPMTTVRNMRLIVEALEAGGAPRPTWTRTRPDGQIVARAFPRTWLEQAVYSGMRVDVWIEPGKPATQGAIYREKAHGVYRAGRVCGVLGAGNVSSIGPLDAIYKLFVEDHVVVLKLNPVNDYLLPMWREAFSTLIAAGFLEIVTGGADVGDALCTHPRVDAIHLTGSDRTHDAIVWGATLEEQERRKAARQPRITKAVSSELGCVTPVIVVPGRWSRASLAYQARNVASMVVHNASFNCTAAKALVLARGWQQREAFLGVLHETLARLPARIAYYPGAQDRYRAFRAQYPSARALAAAGPNVVPWTVIPDVPPNAGEFALTREAFCGVLAEVSLDASDPATFLREAVPFANEHVWGTLSCVVIIDGRTRRAHHAAFDRAIADLRYGGIGVNVWTGANFALGEPSWGAYPGSTPERIRSGIGVVHNTLLFDHPQKSVVHGFFRLRPTPVWFADHRTLDTLGRLALEFEAAPSWRKLPRLAWTGLRG